MFLVVLLLCRSFDLSKIEGVEVVFLSTFGVSLVHNGDWTLDATAVVIMGLGLLPWFCPTVVLSDSRTSD